MKTLRAITWNLGHNGDIGRKIARLEEAIREAGEQAGIIVCLQEVTSDNYRELIRCGLFAEVACSLSIPRSAHFERGTQMLGCAFGCNEKIVLGTSSVSARPMPPELMTPVKLPAHPESAEHVIHIHSLNSNGFNKTKSEQFSTVAQYLHALADQNESVIFCGEANESVVVQKNSDETSAWAAVDGPAGTFFGVNPRQHLQEALKMWLKSHPVCMASLLKTPLDVPVAVTLIKGGDRQYDFVFISPRWTVTHIDQRLSDSAGSGDDHPMVVCDLARAA